MAKAQWTLFSPVTSTTPVIMRIGKWHDGRLAEQTEVLPDCVSDEIAVLAAHLDVLPRTEGTEKAEVCKFETAALYVMTTSKALKGSPVKRAHLGVAAADTGV